MLAIVAMTIGLVALRSRIALYVAAALWAICSIVVLFDRNGPQLDDVRWYAIQEGCIGHEYLFVSISTAICVLMLYGASRVQK